MKNEKVFWSLLFLGVFFVGLQLYLIVFEPKPSRDFAIEALPNMTITGPQAATIRFSDPDQGIQEFIGKAEINSISAEGSYTGHELSGPMQEYFRLTSWFLYTTVNTGEINGTDTEIKQDGTSTWILEPKIGQYYVCHQGKCDIAEEHTKD